MPSVSPIVTRGFGASQKIVTQGYGGVPAIVEEAVRIFRGGKTTIRKKLREKYDEYRIGVLLLSVNDNEIENSKTINSNYRILKENDTTVRSQQPEISHRKSSLYKIIIKGLKILKG